MSLDKNKINGGQSRRLGRLVFGLAVLFTVILVILGISGVHWPKWLLALTTIL